MNAQTNLAGISVRQLAPRDLPTADHVLREAFDTFTGAKDLFGDRDYVRTRWHADPARAIAAEVNGEFGGSNFVTCWGSLGYFGPLSVRPAMWDRGIAKGLMEMTMDLFVAAEITHAGLFTFAHSPKHHGLYQSFGFWPRFLTPILLRPVSPASEVGGRWQSLSALNQRERERAVKDCREITQLIYDGLDVTREIDSVAAQNLGDTVLIADDRIGAFAVCHAGAGTEAGSGGCFIKFAAVRPGSGLAMFDRLLDACEAYAAGAGAGQMEVGVNTGCHEAYQRLMERSYRAGLIGVAMHRPNDAAYDRPGVFVLGDWR